MIRTAQQDDISALELAPVSNVLYDSNTRSLNGCYVRIYSYLINWSTYDEVPHFPKCFSKHLLRRPYTEYPYAVGSEDIAIPTVSVLSAIKGCMAKSQLLNE